MVTADTNGVLLSPINLWHAAATNDTKFSNAVNSVVVISGGSGTNMTNITIYSSASNLVNILIEALIGQTNASLQIKNTNGNTGLVYYPNTGRLGVGTNNPQTTLHVLGNTTVTDFLNPLSDLTGQIGNLSGPRWRAIHAGGVTITNGMVNAANGVTTLNLTASGNVLTTTNAAPTSVTVGITAPDVWFQMKDIQSRLFYIPAYTNH